MDYESNSSKLIRWSRVRPPLGPLDNKRVNNMTDTENTTDTQPDNVIQLQKAERPGKQEMLDLLEELRKQVESGDVGTIMVFAILPAKGTAMFKSGVAVPTMELMGMFFSAAVGECVNSMNRGQKL